jgi:FKBP-type peptidyl-prolyl cis-trans isomerase FkpA
MKRIITFCCAAIFILNVKSQTPTYFSTLPDSLKPIGFITDIIVTTDKSANNILALININDFFLGLRQNKNERDIVFNLGIASTKNRFLKMRLFPYKWQTNETYQLLFLLANDSASKTSVYSGYVFLPKENKWKLLDSKFCTPTFGIKNIVAKNINTKNYTVTFNNKWLLQNNYNWKAMDGQNTKPPLLKPMSNIDSLAQQQEEEKILTAQLPKDSVMYKEGIFYQTIKEGTGNNVKITDTVTVHYKGYLFRNNKIFDETKAEPATFPLNRLIKGWQIGLPQCKVGGKIRLFLPSGLAYGIRTFATDIPPNSILVFDVEVVGVK